MARLLLLEKCVEKPLDVRLLDDFRQNFPLCPAPFAELASRLNVAESAVLRMLERLKREGRIARVGAVFAPKRIGASTLVAMAVPADRLAAVSEAVNRFPEVNHNDERAHRYNLWFVVTAGSEGRLQAALGAIEQAAGLPLLRLPLVKEYLRLSATAEAAPGDAQNERRALAMPLSPPTALDEIGRRLLMVLQEGLPLFIRPFSVLASRVGCDESEVLERIQRWSAEGVIKRFGVVARGHGVAGGSQALLVQDIPDDKVLALGELLVGEADVSLCYQRPRSLPDWPYNLFCMVSAQTADEVRMKISALRLQLGLEPYAHDVLFSFPAAEAGSPR
jgi:DNA-binding Lrp family transcriptional regulator